MQPSLTGLIVVVLLLCAGRAIGNTFVAALIMSVPFGATAFGTLTAVGGASPLIYTLIVVMMWAWLITRRSFAHDLAIVFRQDWAAWIALALIIVGITTAIIMPRLFEGRMIVIQVLRAAGRVGETPLQPSSGNITQAAYFALTFLTYFALRAQFVKRLDANVIINSILAGGWVAAILGLIDFAGKLSGMGDVLEPLRTAEYTMLTGESVLMGGFFRLAGACSEASQYAGTTLPFLAGVASYWRATGTRASFWLMILLTVMLILSTSSTAFVGLAVLGLLWCGSITGRIVFNELTASDMKIAAVAFIVAIIGLVLLVTGSEALNAVIKLIDDAVINKATSDSAVERSLFNRRGLEAFVISGGLGVGPGSTRTSSWAVAVLAQLGVIGAVLMGALVYIIARGVRFRDASEVDPSLLVAARASKALVAGGAPAMLVSGAAIDPGVLSAFGLAVICAVRARTKPYPSKQRGGRVGAPTAQPA